MENEIIYKPDLDREADRRQCLKDLLCFHGLPPFDDPSNVNIESPVLRKRLEKKWGDTLERLERRTGCDRIREQWDAVREQFLKDTGLAVQ